MGGTLLDRPLRKDTLLRLYAIVVVTGITLSARNKVEVGGSFNPDRLAAFIGNSLGVVMLAAIVGLAPLLVRYAVRRSRSSSSGAATGAAASHGQRDRDWTDAPALRLDMGKGEGSTEDGQPAPRRRSPELKVELNEVVTFIGQPVTLTWKAPRADHVLISLLPGQHPPSSNVALHLEYGTDVVVTAVNEHGYREVRTPYVRVLPTPRLTTMAVPRTPALTLSADVRIATGSAAPVAAHLDALLARQAQLRASRHPAAEPGMSMSEAVEKVRSGAASLSGWHPSGDVWPAAGGRSGAAGKPGLAQRARCLLTGVPDWFTSPLPVPRVERPAVPDPSNVSTVLPSFSGYGDYTPTAPAAQNQEGRIDR